MNVIVCDLAEDVGRAAADVVVRRAGSGALRVLGVATGGSPLPLYRALSGTVDLTHVEAFALDEYVGIAADDPASYRAVIDETVRRPLGLDPARVHVPDGLAADLERACADYETAIRAAGGIDLQVLGIGRNGHIGFNEPPARPDSRTRVVALSAETRADNARFFPSLLDVPDRSVTQGVGTILDARELLLVATGAGKADAVRRMLEEPESPLCPGSFLRRHDAITVVLDRVAAAALSADTVAVAHSG